ncbi:MAG: UPF0182 family protein [Acidimicrobiia bacterium]
MKLPTAAGRRRGLGGKRTWLAGLAAALLVLLVSLRGIAGFYTDYLWFAELGYTEVWRGLLVAKALPSVVFTIAFFVLILGNLIIADRIAPRFRPAGPEEEMVERYRQLVGPYVGRVRVAVAAFLALVAGGGLTNQWHEWVLFRNRVDFGASDAQFGTDIGFFVFTMPFLRFIFDWAFAALVIVLLVTAVAHYLNGGIRVQGPLQRVTPQVKAHLSVVLGAMALLKAFGYWLERYELNFSTRGVVEGASYTDVRAELPALNMLMVISVAAALLFLVNIRLRGWVLPAIAVGLWGFVSLVIGTIYPAGVQRFSVEPNEFQKEEQYIERNIEATRAAYGLDRVDVRDFDYQEDLQAADIQANEATIRDARLWDPDVLEQTYRAIQQFRPQYIFGDVDIDRYEIDGETRQIVLSARELDLDNLPSQTWQNTNLVYTHGYGVVASPSNGVTDRGLPEFVLKDIPPQGSALELTQPALYYGERLEGYAIVNTTQREYDFPAEPRDATTTYRGEGGVPMKGLIRRGAFFLRFGEFKLLLSDQITPSSRALYLRDIRERVSKAAPFLRYDSDPYPVVLDGRVLWVIDAYTTTSRFPYSQSYVQAHPDRLPASSGLRGAQFNYVRNSVKATVDAYDGTVKFYVFSEGAGRDPLVEAYRKAFPRLFTDRDQMPPGLEEHLRYPEDLFRVQTDHFSEYHVTDPQPFYTNSRQWAVAQDPGSGPLQVDGSGTTAATLAPSPAPGGRAATVPLSRKPRMEPYYLQMRLPGQTEENFLILQPFVPTARSGEELTNLVAFMVAKSDPGEYGKLEAYQMPVGQVIRGPDQINTIINTQPEISSQFTLLNRAGSQVRQGSLLLIPVEESILYIRPVYLQGTQGTRLPEFQFVAVVYADRAVLGSSLNDALAKLFPGLSPEPPPSVPGATPPGETPPGETPPPPETTDVASLLAQAEAAYQEAQTALRAGDLAGYQRAVDRVGELLRQATTGTGGTPAPATTTTTTAPPG